MKPDGYCALLDAAAPHPDAVAELASAATANGLAMTLLANAAIASGPRCGVLRLPREAGVVLGTLFDRSGRRVEALSPETVAGWIASGGRLLIERYWGAWLAILISPDGALLVRDPSGLFPCYHRAHGAMVTAASDLPWSDLAGPADRAVCRDELHAQLQYASLRTERTAIEGLRELLPGASLRVRRDGAAIEQIWTPWQFVRREGPPADFAEAAERLRRGLELVIGSWTKPFSRPLIDLSGGLDSSIVAAASARHVPALEAVTYRGSDADLDEGRYAKAVAGHLGIAWHQAVLDGELVDLHSSAARDLPRPSARSFSQANDLQDLELAQALGCDAFLTGAGGDGVLWYFNTAAPALDRLHVEGMGGFLRTVRDLADMCGVSRAESLGIALRKLRQRRPRPWPHSTAFLSPEAQRLAGYPVHPWWPGPKDALPGVRAYVLALIQLSDHHEYHLRSAFAPVLAPLASQPLVETCLGIPSWLSCTGGANRAVARAAFAGRLPASILARRTKGGFDGFVHDLLERNRPLVRAMLVEGALARDGWLDTAAIAGALDHPAPVAPGSAARLLRLIAVEAWLSSVRRH